MKDIKIRLATDLDFAAIWVIFQRVISQGDTYAYSPDTTKEEAYHLWMPPGRETFVAIIDHKIVGTYFLKANQPGLGSHIANAAYMVDPNFHGQGIGLAIAQHSFEEAKKRGYLAMQFNFVVSTNYPAVNLWKKMGFEIIGITPNGFKHSSAGYVDTLIMYKKLLGQG